jgi:hypothetical protein
MRGGDFGIVGDNLPPRWSDVYYVLKGNSTSWADSPQTGWFQVRIVAVTGKQGSGRQV